MKKDYLYPLMIIIFTLILFLFFKGVKAIDYSKYIDLLENTYHCLGECHATIRIHDLPSDITIDSSDKLKLWYNKTKNSLDLDVLKFQLRINETYYITNPVFDCTDHGLNPDGSVNITCVKIGEEQIQKWRWTWKNFNPLGKTLKAGKEYIIRIYGKKKIKLGENNVDWKIRLMNYEPDWAWWNISYTKCKNVNITHDTSEDWKIVHVNVTYDSDMKSDFSDVVFVDTICDNDGNELGFMRLKTVSSSYALFRVNTSLINGDKQISMYYGYASADDKSDITKVYGDNVILLLTFDEDSGSTVTDYSGLGNDGTIFNADRVSGRWGNALRIDANYENTTVPNTNLLNPDQVTMTMWLKPSSDQSQQSYRRILEKSSNVSESPYLSYVLTTGQIGADQSTIQNAYYFEGDASYTHNQINDNFPTDSFTHVLGDYNGSYLNVFINNTLGTATSGYSNPYSVGSKKIGYTIPDLSIGMRRFDGTNHYDGIIDDVILFNDSLTPSERNAFYIGSDPTITFGFEIAGGGTNAIYIESILENPDPIEAGNQITIKSNVTHSDNRDNISHVLISLFDPQDDLRVNNVSMTKGSQVTVSGRPGYEYSYDYTTPSTTDDLGTWDIEIYVNESQVSNEDFSTSTFIEEDTTPPNIAYVTPTPGDNSRQTGNSITVKTTVSDGVEVDNCIFEWNGTGSKVNETLTVEGGQCNKTKTTVDGTVYTFKMYVNDTSGNENSVAERIFRENALPSEPSNLSPNNIRLIGNSQNLTWDSSTDSDGDSVTYNLQVEEDTCSFSFPYHHSDSILSDPFDIVSTNDNHYYCWRVRAEDGYENTNWIQANFTENGLPYISLNITPPFPSQSDTLTCNYWNLGDPDGDSTSIHYYEWFVNDVDQNQNESTLSTGFSDGDIVYCVINITDGYEYYQNQSSSVSIGSLTVNSETYETDLIEGETDNITIVWDYTPASVSNLINVSLIWNGTDLDYDGYSDSGTQFTYYKIVTASQVKSLSETIDFYWSYIINYTGNGTSEEKQTTTHQQTIHKILMGNCTYLNETALTFNIIYEENDTAIPSDVEMFGTVIYGSLDYNFTETFNDTSTFSLCLYPSYATYKLDLDLIYSNKDYTTRAYYLRNASVDNTTNNITLYQHDDVYDIRIYVYDEVSIAVEEAIVKAQKLDWGTNSYKTVAMTKTDFEGESLTHLETTDEWYRFVVNTYGNDPSSYLFSPKQLYYDSSVGYVTVKLNLGESTEMTSLRDFAYDCSYNSTTRLLRCELTSTTGLHSTICLDVYSWQGMGYNNHSYNYCTQDVSAQLSTLLPNITGSYYYEFTYTDSTTGEKYIVDSGYANIFIPSEVAETVFLVVLSTITIGTFGLIAIKRADLHIISILLGLGVCGVIGLMNITLGGITAIGVVGVVIWYKVKT